MVYTKSTIKSGYVHSHYYYQDYQFQGRCCFGTIRESRFTVGTERRLEKGAYQIHEIIKFAAMQVPSRQVFLYIWFVRRFYTDHAYLRKQRYNRQM